MNNKINRLILFLVGLFVLSIPAIFLCYELDEVYKFSKESHKESLKQKLLTTVSSLEKDLDPFNYIKSEFDKIHASLFPKFPNETIEGIPDEEYAKNIYSKETFDKLLTTIKDRFNPIIIDMGIHNLDKFIHYISPELDIQFENKEDKEYFLLSRLYFDYRTIRNCYINNFNSEPKETLKIYKLVGTNNFKNEYGKYPFKYTSKYLHYEHNTEPAYTDYFNKQILYPIIKYTISKRGVHGYYSIYIPQSHIDPEEIIKSALSRKTKNIDLEIKDNNFPTEIKETESGFEYYINIPTILFNHIKNFKKLRNIDRNYLLKKQFYIKITYPEEINNLSKLSTISKYICSLLILFYIAISLLISKKQFFSFNLTNKLIVILSIIIFLPLISTELLIMVSVKNIGELIDYNVSKSLHNEIENLNIKNKENNIRLLSSIYEIKRKIHKFNFNQNHQKHIISNDFMPKKERDSWFFDWNREIYMITEYGKIFTFENKDYFLENQARFYGDFLNYYFGKFGINLKKGRYSKQDLTLSILEKILTPQTEESSIGQEGIWHRKVLNWLDTVLGIYFFAKDKNNKNVLCYTSKTDEKDSYFKYLDNIFKKYSFLYFKPENKYAEIDLNIIFNSHKEEYKKFWPPQNLLDKSVNENTQQALAYKDSGHNITKQEKGSLIKEWLFNYNDPIVINGIATSDHNTMFIFWLQMIVPILFVYAVLLLILLTNFISKLIKKPVYIYNQAIALLDNNIFGTTINSFSKDEFNYITTAFNEMSIALKQKEQIKRFVSDRLVQSVESDEIQKAEDGKQEKVTILSSDIRNFTGISEMYEPSEIVEMLNSYFTKMQKAISENGGIIDKYIGDAIQAVFYDEQDKENQVIRAAKAAVAMRKALKEFNEERESKGLFTIENGIGIDTDFAITGTIGTADGRKDFSVNGDVIARAAELEAKTKGTISKILLSKASLEELCPQKPLLKEGNKRGGDGISSKHNSNPQPLSQEEKGYRVQDIGRKGNVLANDSLLQNRHCEPSLDGVAIQKDIENTLSLNKICSSSVTSQSLRDSSPLGEPLEEDTNHLSQTTHNSEAQASLPLPSSLYPKNMDCHENKTVYNTSLVYQDFDENSVELQDVRE